MVLADATYRWEAVVKPKLQQTYGVDQDRRHLTAWGLSTGTDEHGLKVWQAAQKHAINEPKIFCDQISAHFSHLAKALGLGKDLGPNGNFKFIRTTDPEHFKTVQYFWVRIVHLNSLNFKETFT